MSIAVSDDGRALAEGVRAWAEGTIDQDVRRAHVGDGTDTLPVFWTSLAQQGFLGVHLPEADGGGGAGMAELAVVVEELGRALAPGPAIPTMLASAVLAEAGHERVAALADGSRVAAVGLGAGSLALADGSLTGTSDWVVGGHTADTFLLPVATDDGADGWVVVDRDVVDVTDDDSHDVTRRMSRVTAREVAVPVVDQLDVDPQRPRDLAAIVFGSESSGIADWAVSTAAEYARVREQFGRPVGQFQGVKHRCAWMLALAEQARAAAWDAANVEDLDDVPAHEASLAAAVVGALAPQVALDTAKDCIQTLGGIGFTWEHDAHLYLRRALSVRIALGSTTAWRQRVAELALAGVRRDPQVELPASADEVRHRVRADLAPAREASRDEQKRVLAEAGFTAPHLPEPWGRGADAVEQLVIAEELDAAGLRPHDMIIGNWIVPTLISGGTEEQLEEFVPASLRGDIVWCQLFSEPGAGSDLASLTTRAIRVEGGWVLRGQKVWTSLARRADYGVVLARTDPDAPRHEGISYFILDMDAPGLDIRPLREITGEALFNEIFLDDVFVPEDRLVGEVDQGWRLARTTLANERVSLSGGSTVGDVGEVLVEQGRSRDLTAVEQETLGRLLCDAQARSMLGLRTTLRSLQGGQPGPESSVAKLIGSTNQQQGWETAMLWVGMDALTEQARSGSRRQALALRYLNSKQMTIAGGTTDVLLNIIGERILRLPRDPRPVER